jgi:hypothetical protein
MIATVERVIEGLPCPLLYPQSAGGREKPTGRSVSVLSLVRQESTQGGKKPTQSTLKFDFLQPPMFGKTPDESLVSGFSDLSLRLHAQDEVRGIGSEKVLMRAMLAIYPTRQHTQKHTQAFP